MTIRFLLFATALAVAAPAFSTQNQSPNSTSSTDSTLLHEIIAETWDFLVRELPLSVAGGEFDRFPTEIGSFEEADFQRRAAFFKKQFDRLLAINPKNLGHEDKINRELLLFTLDDEVQTARFGFYKMPLLSDDGPHIWFAGLPSGLPFSTVVDYENYLARLQKFPKFIGQWTARLRDGIRAGMTTPRIVLANYATTWEQHLVENADSSLFFRPFKNWPATFSEAEKTRLAAAARQLILTEIVPGYRAFGAFMNTEYLPACRTTIGASDLPDGAAIYQQRIRFFTTQDLTAAEIHRLGLAEVARIDGDMKAIIKEVGFAGSFAEFLDFMRNDPRFYAKTGDELLKEAAWIAKKADGQLPRFFGKLPRQPYTVVPVPAHLAPVYTGGRYSGASISGTSSGQYWVNKYNLPARPFYNLEALTLHEAVPGHHLQTALSQELTGLPPFRQGLYVNAFGEGWALYCEWLGQEMGFYQTPYNRFGRLTYEMWRACRLVVDTGLHSMGWSRDEAMAYLSSHTALSLHECRTETDRYIGWPGQALSYKIGELKIRELRRKTEKRLGKNFDIREFHDLILSEGTLTLGILERLVSEWKR